MSDPGVRHLLVGCDAFYEDFYEAHDGAGEWSSDGGGASGLGAGSGSGRISTGSGGRISDGGDGDGVVGGSPMKTAAPHAPIPRLNPWAPNLKRLQELKPTLVGLGRRCSKYPSAHSKPLILESNSIV